MKWNFLNPLIKERQEKKKQKADLTKREARSGEYF
jgi:hypothetical protein